MLVGSALPAGVLVDGSWVLDSGVGAEFVAEVVVVVVVLVLVLGPVLGLGLGIDVPWGA